MSQEFTQELTKDELKRYSRHLIMPEVGLDGQKIIKNAKILIIGAGGLGSPIALYLTAAGVGTIGIVDFDKVDYTNLQRQILYTTNDVGKPKVSCAKEHLKAQNPSVNLIVHETKLSSENALHILQGYDIIIDGTDNFPTRYLINDACVFLKKPLVYGSIFRFDGQVTVFDSRIGPCYRCLYPEPPTAESVPNCAEAGVIGILPGIIGTLQANEAVKLILKKGQALVGRLLLFDALEMKFRELKLRKDTECVVCSNNPKITSLIDYEQFCGIGNNEIRTESEYEITPVELKRILDEKKPVTIVDVREPFEYDICRINGSRLIPLGQVQQRMNELDANELIVLHCHHGARSAQALMLLRDSGFKKLKNLVGGIEQWAEDVEPEMNRY